MLKKLLANTQIAVAMLTTGLLLHVYWLINELSPKLQPGNTSITKPNFGLDANDFTIMGRYGALMTLIGYCLTIGEYLRQQDNVDSTSNKFDYRLGISMIFFGTIMWGYGDVIIFKSFVLALQKYIQ